MDSPLKSASCRSFFKLHAKCALNVAQRAREGQTTTPTLPRGWRTRFERFERFKDAEEAAARPALASPMEPIAFLEDSTQFLVTVAEWSPSVCAALFVRWAIRLCGSLLGSLLGSLCGFRCVALCHLILFQYVCGSSAIRRIMRSLYFRLSSASFGPALYPPPYSRTHRPNQKLGCSVFSFRF